jgi:hypothetical protein
VTVRRAIEIASFTWYVVVSAALVVAHLSSAHTLGFDGWLYREAAATWLAGGDPWSVGADNAHFAGTPATLLAFVPTTFLSGEAWRLGSVVVAAAAAVYALRRAGLRLYWLIYPPLFVGVLLGQPSILILALLVSPAAFLAPFVKAIGGIPLLWRPWHAVAAGAVAVAAFLAAPALWREWVARLPELSTRLQAELHGGSPWWLVGLGAIALLVIIRYRPEHAPWLAVPALWPLPEYHYGILALPTGVPLLLAAIAIVPGQLPIVGYAGWLIVARRFDVAGLFIEGRSRVVAVSGAWRRSAGSAESAGSVAPNEQQPVGVAVGPPPAAVR